LPYGELLTALTAFLPSVSLLAFRVLLGGLGANVNQTVGAIHHAAMRADRTIRPEHGLDRLERGDFVVKAGANRTDMTFSSTS